MASIAADASIPDSLGAQSWCLSLNGHLINTQNSTATLTTVGIKDGDFLEAAARPANATSRAPHTQQSQRRQQQQQQQQQQQTAAAQSQFPQPSNDQIEEVRQRLVSDPQLRTGFLQQHPQLSSTLNDATQFRTAFHALEHERRNQLAARDAELQRLENDVTSENQAKILEMIRQQKFQSDIDDIIENNPEMLGGVTMLYISLEVNGREVKALVDSGAQTTVMSPDCAERCGITHLIDSRFSGEARGVGIAKILGRVHKCTVKIGFDELPCMFTVMEGKEVDMLLGLDMLKRYQASINLVNQTLVFPEGQSVPFLPESDIPKFGRLAAERGRDLQEQGQGQGTTMSGALQPPAATATAGPSSSFSGAGRTLNSLNQPAATSSTPQQRPPPAPQRDINPSASASRPQAPTPGFGAPSFPQSAIDTLQGIGATREQAITALQSCGGNVEMAAALLFEGGF